MGSGESKVRHFSVDRGFICHVGVLEAVEAGSVPCFGATHELHGIS